MYRHIKHRIKRYLRQWQLRKLAEVGGVYKKTVTVIGAASDKSVKERCDYIPSSVS